MRRPMHPDWSRKVATHVIEEVWGEDTNDYEQVQPGVFVSDDGALLVAAGAQVSEPGLNTLRLTGRLWEVAALVYASGEVVLIGPRHLYSQEEWSASVTRMVALTCDVQTVFTTFEVAPMTSAYERADVGAVSAIVGAAVPTDVDPNPELLAVLMDQCDAAVQKAA